MQVISSRPHPLIIAAAISIIVFSLVGVGVMTGLIPTASSRHDTGAPALTMPRTPGIDPFTAGMSLNEPASLTDSAPLAEPAGSGSLAGTTPGEDRLAAALPAEPVPAAKPATAAGRAPEPAVEPAPRPEKPATKTAPAEDMVVRTDPAPVGDYRPVAAGESSAARRDVCESCGTVESVAAIQETSGTGGVGQTPGLGAVAGGVIGGLLGNQVGGGSGKTIATIAGAAGGAYAGHRVQQHYGNKRQRYDITVRMDDGDTRTFTRDYDPGLLTGDRVRLDGDELALIE